MLLEVLKDNYNYVLCQDEIIYCDCMAINVVKNARGR